MKSSPLPNKDVDGNEISVGAEVTIITIPQWLTHDLPAEEIAELKLLEKTTMTVIEIDQHGYVWFGNNGAEKWFCLRPEEVRVNRVHE